MMMTQVVHRQFDNISGLWFDFVTASSSLLLPHKKQKLWQPNTKWFSRVKIMKMHLTIFRITLTADPIKEWINMNTFYKTERKDILQMWKNTDTSYTEGMNKCEYILQNILIHKYHANLSMTSTKPWLCLWVCSI